MSINQEPEKKCRCGNGALHGKHTELVCFTHESPQESHKKGTICKKCGCVIPGTGQSVGFDGYCGCLQEKPVGVCPHEHHFEDGPYVRCFKCREILPDMKPSPSSIAGDGPYCPSSDPRDIGLFRDGYAQGLAARDKEVGELVEALKYYADYKSWDYTDSGGQFSWNATIKDDVDLNPEVGEGGGTDYAGKRARAALAKFESSKEPK